METNADHPATLMFEFINPDDGAKCRVVGVPDGRVFIERLSGRDLLGVERWDLVYLDGTVIDTQALGSIIAAAQAAARAKPGAERDFCPFAPEQAPGLPPLPDGWRWHHDPCEIANYAEAVVEAVGGEAWVKDGAPGEAECAPLVWVDVGGDPTLELEQGYDRVPLAVVRAVIARHDAEQASKAGDR